MSEARHSASVCDMMRRHPSAAEAVLISRWWSQSQPTDKAARRPN